MLNKKYITTTLPYSNGYPHIGHCYEFCIADIITDFYRYKLGSDNVFFNTGIDEHGQKIHQKASEEGYTNVQDYCNKLAIIWETFCKDFQIDYNNFYRTTDIKHKEYSKKYFEEIKQYLYIKSYDGKYCVGCESFKTDKEIENNKCITHKLELTNVEEENTFFALSKFSNEIKDILVNKSLSKEFNNLLTDEYDLSITRKNVKWGVELNDTETLYVWFEALLNYVLAIKYYDDKEYFNSYWENSLQICGKDNLKFQSYILQSILLANNISQTKELLVHGTILDENGSKMSKSLGNVIDPIEQKEKYGLSPLKYYLTFGLSIFDDSKYSEKELINLWNSEIVNGFGNLVSRTLHLIDIKNIIIDDNVSNKIKSDTLELNGDIESAFEKYNFVTVKSLLNSVVVKLNKRFQEDRPFDKTCENYEIILNEIYYELKNISNYYSLILKEHKTEINEAFVNNKKVILFKILEKY